MYAYTVYVCTWLHHGVFDRSRSPSLARETKNVRAKRTHLPFRVLRQVRGYPSTSVQGLSIAMFIHHKSEHVDIVAIVEFLDFRVNCILTQICEDHLFNAL